MFKNFSFSRTFLHCLFFLKKKLYLILVVFFGIFIFILAQKGLTILKRVDVKPKDLLSFFGQTTDTLNSQNGVTNFLFLGIRGEGVDSPNLTDSLIFVSYNKNNNKISEISIPRDLWIPSLQDRINTAYHYGEEASPGAGIKLAETSVLEVLGQPINYTVIINFNLFQQVVDLLGGLDIYVSPGFTDSEYPIPGKENALPISSRYQTITFSEGQNHLNGDLALKYVRSRHSAGEEGTDFARSRRQQQIITALKDKVFNKDFLLNTQKIENLLQLTEHNLTTNISANLYPIIARIGVDQIGKTINYIGLSTIPDKNGVSILTNPPAEKYGGRWVLIPKDNNWKALKQYIQNQLEFN